AGLGRASTPRAARGVLCRRSCRSAAATAALSSESVITSLFTIATMRSTSCAPCASATAGRKTTTSTNHRIVRFLEYLFKRQAPAQAGRDERRVIGIGYLVARHAA